MEAIEDAPQLPETPPRFSWKRAERRRMQRIVIKAMEARKKRKKLPRRKQKYNRATRRAMQRVAWRAARKQICAAQRQMPMLCSRCQQPYLGPTGWRCACKVERQVEFAAAI